MIPRDTRPRFLHPDVKQTRGRRGRERERKRERERERERERKKRGEKL